MTKMTLYDENDFSTLKWDELT